MVEIAPRRFTSTCHSCVATWWDAVKGTGPMPPDFAWRSELLARGYAACDALVAPSRSFATATQRAYGLPQAPEVVRNGRMFVPPFAKNHSSTLRMASSVGTSAAASLPAVRRATLARRGPPSSRFELTRITSVLTSPLPALVRDSPAAPPAPIPTKVGFTIAVFGGVAAIVLLT